jgi:glutamate-1-semialdehyde 2,1-aminomutase
MIFDNYSKSIKREVHVLAILQARVSSSRLPNKVMKTIINKPMLELQIERIKRAQLVNKLIVATSVNGDDDPLEGLCRRLGVGCFRGSLEDVLDRFHRAAAEYTPKYVVRLTGDCPLVDPEIIDYVIKYCIRGEYDYASNTLEPTYPDGLDVEVFKYAALETACREANLPSEREHVTPFIYNNLKHFNIGSIKAEKNLSHMRWTVDENEDLVFVKKIYEALYETKPEFNKDDILSIIEKNPEWIKINSVYSRNEGYKRSLEMDGKHMFIDAHKKCFEMQSRAKELIPGMTQLLSKRPDQFSQGVWPGYYSKAKGALIWDLDGNEYVDMSISGIGANILGYADEDVDRAVMDVVRSGSSCSLNCPEEVELAELLCEIHPWAEMVRYARTGGESMAVAVRIARAATGRDKIAFCGYHGWHDWYLAANLRGNSVLDGHLLPGLQPNGVPRGLLGTALPFRYNQLDELEKIVKENKGDIAAVILETIRNEQPKPEFLEGVRRIASDLGAVLIFDEISSGFRLTSGGAHLLFDVNPDIAVFSKAIGNGYPMGVILGVSDIMMEAQKSFISSTNWSERIGPVAAIATIRKHCEHNVSKHLMEVGKRIQKGWLSAARNNNIEISVGGIPPLSHFTFNYSDKMAAKALFVQMMLERGYLASTSFYAMYAHSEILIDNYVDAVNQVFKLMGDIIRRGDLEKSLYGKPASMGFSRLL